MEDKSKQDFEELHLTRKRISISLAKLDTMVSVGQELVI